MPQEAVKSGRRAWIIAAVVVVVSLGGAAATLAVGEEEAIRPSTDRSVPVRVTVAAESDLTVRTSLRGELTSDVAELAARSTGHLISVSVGIGDQVKEGTVLARIEPTNAQNDVALAQAEVRSAQAALKRSQSRLQAAEVELKRAEKLLEHKLISAQDADAREAEVKILRAEAEAANAQLAQARARVHASGDKLSETRLLAPFDGAVAERYVDPGTIVQPGTVILRLVRGGPLRVRFRVAERDIGRLSVGMPFEVKTQASGERAFAGKVTRIGAEIARSDRTVPVEGELDGRPDILRPGMYAEVILTLDTLDKVVVVPSLAILERVSDEGLPHRGVFVVRDGKAAWTPVNVLGAAGDRTAVEGVALGEQVVSLGHDGLRDGTAVRISEALES